MVFVKMNNAPLHSFSIIDTTMEERKVNAFKWWNENKTYAMRFSSQEMVVKAWEYEICVKFRQVVLVLIDFSCLPFLLFWCTKKAVVILQIYLEQGNRQCLINDSTLQELPAQRSVIPLRMHNSPQTIQSHNSSTQPLRSGRLVCPTQ